MAYISTPSCSGQEETLYLYLDDELPLAERSAFESHLQHCQTCRALLAETEALFAEIANWEELAPPPNIALQVMANMPLPVVAPEPDRYNLLLLAGQMAIGLLLLLVAIPKLLTMYQLLPPKWNTPEITAFIVAGSEQLRVSAALQTNWLYAQWTQITGHIGFNFAPGLAVALAGGLILAWLIGNGLLLGRNSLSIKGSG